MYRSLERRLALLLAFPRLSVFSEQLGSKLQRLKRMADVLVIDRIERPTPN